MGEGDKEAMSTKQQLVEGLDPLERLTVEEAALEVGVSARTIRKYLGQPQWAGVFLSEQRETASGWRTLRTITRDTARRMGRAARFLEPEPLVELQHGEEAQQDNGDRRQVVATLEVNIYG